jgi:polysaccharide export outer membrane protein
MEERIVSSMSWSKLSSIGVVMLAATGCAGRGSNLPPLPTTSSINEPYVLGSGDHLQITLYGTSDPSGLPGARPDISAQPFIAETGTVDTPLIGPIEAAGLTTDQLKAAITQKLAQGYINDPRVGVDVIAYRPYYIMGEVNHPGAYAATAKSRVLSAVAVAGGYTFRANEDFAVVQRTKGDEIVTGRVTPDAPIMPGDIVRISERIF